MQPHITPTPNVTPATTPQRLVVVDPRLHDYLSLVTPARDNRLRLTLTTSGSNALRLAASFADALWIVNPQLPDIDGLDLVEMLRSLEAKLNAVVLDNAYDRSREQRALELQVVQYVCKPLEPAWLSAWQGRASPPKTGPSAAPHECDARVTWQSSQPTTIPRLGDPS